MTHRVHLAARSRYGNRTPGIGVRWGEGSLLELPSVHQQWPLRSISYQACSTRLKTREVGGAPHFGTLPYILMNCQHFT